MANNELIENMREKFRVYYAANLQGKFAELEPVRKKYLRKFWIRCMLVVGWYVIMFTVLLSGEKSAEEVFSEPAVVMIIILMLCLLGIWIVRPLSAYKKEAKKTVMDKILKFWGDFGYSDKIGTYLSLKSVEACGLFPRIDLQRTDDDYRGIYRGTEVTISEQCLLQEQWMHNNMYYMPVFRGIIILFEFNRKFAGKTIVRSGLGGVNSASLAGAAIGLPMALSSNKGNLALEIGSAIAGMMAQNKGADGKALQNIKLEDPVFEKEWEVYATDQVEARYILTPALMERMLEIKRRFYGKSIEFSFFDNQVLIAVRTNKDMFETTSLFTPALAYHKVQEVVAQFYSVFSAVDLLLGQRYSKTGEE